MPSTPSPSLRLELIGAGEQAGFWNVTTNNNLGGLLEQAITGRTTVNVTSSDATLTSLNYVVDEARSAVLVATGTPGVTRVITIPNVIKYYTLINQTTNIVQVKTASGSAFDCPPSATTILACDGSNGVQGSGIAPLTSPTFTGTPTAPTASVGTNTTQLATTAFVNTEIASDTANLAPKASPTFTGIPIAPTAATGTNTTQIATTAFVNAEIASDTANLAPIASPTFTGVPAAPTAAVNTNTTQLATTAFVNAEIANDAPTKTGTGASGTWGISITGNAATATSATNASQLGGVAAASYAQLGTTQTFTGAKTFTGNIFSTAYNFTSLTSIFSSGNTDIQMFVNGSFQFKIDSSGDLSINGSNATKASGTTWINPSDARLKDNVVSYTKGLNELVQIQPKSFTFNGKGGSSAGLNAVGIIADEIEQVLPSTVNKRMAKLNAGDEQETEIRYFDASELTWVMVNAIKELKLEVDALSAQLAALKT